MSNALDSLLSPRRLAECRQGDADLMAGLDHTMQQALAPLFIRPAAVAVTPEVRRAAYVSALIKFDWQWEHAEGNAWRKGRDELKRMRAERAAVDPTGELWLRHAAPEYHSDITLS